MPRTVVFDIGNVLIRWEPDELYSRLIPDAAKRSAFFAETGLFDWNLEQDRGRPWREAEEALIALHPHRADLIRAFRARWHEMIPGEIAANVAVLAQIRAMGLPNYAITNFAADTFREAQARFPFLAEGFHGIVVSGEEWLIKPDPAIFRLFLTRYGQQAADCLFIDDSAKNIESAAALGFATIRVTPGTDLRQEVRRHGFAV
jgi:2-haloacid dehalogenase